MVSITILGADGAPAGATEISGAWSDEQAMSAISAMNALVLKVEDLLAALQPTGTLRDAAVFPLGQVVSSDQMGRGVTHGSNGGRLRVVKGLDDDSVVVVGGQVHDYLKGADPLGLYLRSSQGQAQMRFRKALAQGRARVALIGDSWALRPNFGQGIKDQLCGVAGQGKYGHAEFGWVTSYATTAEGVTSFTGLDGMMMTYTGGWKAGIQPPPVPGAPPDDARLRRHDVYDWGPDGYWCSGTGTAGTVTLSDAAGTDVATQFAFDRLTDYYYRHGHAGTMYRILVDGEVKAAVSGDGVPGWDKVEVAGLGDSGHVVTFDLSGNGGTVVRYGCYLGRSAGTGVGFSTLGHAGARIYSLGGQRLNKGKGILQPNTPFGDGRNFAWEMFRDLGFDSVAVVIGTNDARTEGGIGYYTYGLTQTVARLKAMAADTGVILMPSPATFDSGTRTMSERSLAEAMYRIAGETYGATDSDIGVDFWNLFGAAPVYAVANASGYYEDEQDGNGNHVTAAGGQALGRAFVQAGLL